MANVTNDKLVPLNNYKRMHNLWFCVLCSVGVGYHCLKGSSRDSIDKQMGRRVTVIS